MHLPHLQDLSTSRIFPLARVSISFFPGPLLPSKTTFFGNPSIPPLIRSCPHLNSLCAEAQHVISLLIANSVFCLLINCSIWDWLLLLSAAVNERCNQLKLVAARQ